MTKYTAWTDGAYRNSTGRGGWGVVIEPDPDLVNPSDADEGLEMGATVPPPTTNQRTEMLAVLEVLRRVPLDAPVTLYSDSQYVIYTLTKYWKRRANLDIWHKIDLLLSARIANEGETDLQWVPRNSTPELETADLLAKKGSTA